MIQTYVTVPIVTYAGTWGRKNNLNKTKNNSVRTVKLLTFKLNMSLAPPSVFSLAVALNQSESLASPIKQSTVLIFFFLIIGQFCLKVMKLNTQPVALLALVFAKHWKRNMLREREKENPAP